MNLRPSQAVVMVAAPYHLIEDRADPPFRFSWYRDGGPGYVAAFRNDGLIYVAGFEKKERAIEYALEKGWIEI